MIGIDFDNTIVCYDELFQQVAVEHGLVPPHAATSKTAIRDYLRSVGQEDRWTELQGTVYGPRMIDAPPFPGVVEFLNACRTAGMPVAIVSHRTRFPYLGERHDLHVAARDWLVRHGFHDATAIGLPAERVFLEETKEAKLARIAALGCTHFVDDLPELLAHPLFPTHVRRILFDPQCQHGAPPGVEVAPSWSRMFSMLPTRTVGSIAPIVAAAGLSPPRSIERLPGGGNNRVYRVEAATGPVLLKEYYRHPADTRDRLGAEQAFSRFAWDHGIRALPRPLACNHEAGLGVYEFIAGRNLSANELTAAHVDEAVAFFTAVNRHRGDPDAAALPIASEACFSITDHLTCVERRLARLDTIDAESESHRRAAVLVTARMRPLWKRLHAAAIAQAVSLDIPLDRAIPHDARIVSPSDFGFHNCLATDAGLRFIDFEYAGWDDPAKTVCDFFCQPAVPVPQEHFERFMQAANELVGTNGLRDRVSLLMPAYEVKW